MHRQLNYAIVSPYKQGGGLRYTWKFMYNNTILNVILSRKQEEVDLACVESHKSM